jgi:hypothetical protein
MERRVRTIQVPAYSKLSKLKRENYTPEGSCEFQNSDPAPIAESLPFLS